MERYFIGILKLCKIDILSFDFDIDFGFVKYISIIIFINYFFYIRLLI